MKVAIIGFGDRGQLYANLFNTFGATVVAVCDKDKNKISLAQSIYKLENKNCYIDENEFFNKGKVADLLVISTLDQHHYDHALKAIDIGYDILLEKPITTTIQKCSEIEKRATVKGVKVFLCYVLRYAPFFIKIKELLDSKILGNLATVNLSECVGYWHQAHSFVRGNWRNSVEATPMIVAKCCHDLDLLYWLCDSEPIAISSMGSLSFFKKENAPKDSADFCCDCKIAKECPYENLKFYANPDRTWWIRKTGYYKGENGDEKALKELFKDKSIPYSRCVFKCDNDVVDHQITNIMFEGGITAHLTMTAFSKDCFRKIHLHCTYGEIYGDLEESVLYVNVFGKESKKIDISLDKSLEGHGGGDPLMIKSIVNAYENGQTIDKNGIKGAMISHYLAFLAEESRLSNGKVLELKKYFEKIK